MRFNNPLDADQLDRALSRMEPLAEPRWLDVGCGRGELLAMALERFGGTALGVDRDVAAIEAARRRLAFAGDRVRLIAEPADTVPWRPGSFDRAFCIGSTHAYGGPGEGFAATLDALGEVVADGGYVLVGEGFWRQPPPRGYLDATGIGEGDFTTHEENAAEGTRRGWTLVSAETSSVRSWDRFEQGFWDAAEARLAADPSGPEAIENADHWRNWRAAYERWGRDTLGFGLYLWRRGGSTG